MGEKYSHKPQFVFYGAAWHGCRLLPIIVECRLHALKKVCKQQCTTMAEVVLHH